MYLGYDENGNIITKDPSGERGEGIRQIMGEHDMTGEEYMGALKKMRLKKKKALQRAAQRRAEALKSAQAKKAAQKAAAQRRASDARFLKQAKRSKAGSAYAGLSGFMGDGLTPNFVSGEVLAETFKSNYGLSGADFGFSQMGAYTPEFVKDAVRKVYEKMLRIEKSIKLQFDTLESLKTQGKANTPGYLALKANYDRLYKEYQNTPVKVATFSWPSRRQMFVEFGLKLKSLIEKIDSSAAKNMALMFAAPVVYDQQVKSGAIKAAFSGYGFGSEFTRHDQEMGFLPLLAIPAWQAIAAAFAGGSLLYVVYSYVTNPIPAIDKSLDDSSKLIADALKAGQFEVAQKLTEQRAQQIQQKTEAVSSSGITGQIKSATQNIAKTAMIIGVGFLIFKFGLPLLQSKMNKSAQAGA